MMQPGRGDRCEDRSLSFLYPEEHLKHNKRNAECARARVATRVADLSVPRPVASQRRAPHSALVQKQRVSETTVPGCRGKAEASKEPEGSEMKVSLRNLYRILLEPVRQYLVGSQAIIVPDGLLALVPFSALIDENGHYAGESLQVRLIPSLSTAKMIQERPEKPGDKGIPLIVGDPEVGKVMRDDGTVVLVDRLSSAEKEAEVISEMLPVELLIGSEATKEKVLDKVGSASLIHFAAHGDKKRGEILLARRPGTEGEIPKARDLMLLTSDLERRRIKAKLVVLSCCHSGCGDVKAAEGVVGIARAFLGAGARAVLVTLWAIDDGATLWFMAHFYDHLRRGGSAMEALNKGMKAVRELGRRFQHPRYWAPFVLLGEDAIPFPDAVK